MALSEYEKRVLEEMEADLRRADPGLASQMSSAASSADPSGKRPSPRRIGLGALIAIAGLGVLIAAVSFGYSPWTILLGVVGFALMVGGIFFAVTPGASSTDSGKARSGRASGGSSWSAFLADQERRWDERR
ncbi:DUF3040 domain-containing protein [Actinomyces sp. B33]|uniref:DUF3040 domain-containing protein n=1 Tax=Actinomyces sp. B33 TaxID=2942131 RepID=UPI002341704A|nr:DUF3040 domain-containing protein [Actinomyces sp. B33]MDC4233073.1 DUF3040 domain-containing protein [Actinomyces sp. B33]